MGFNCHEMTQNTHISIATPWAYNRTKIQTCLLLLEHKTHVRKRTHNKHKKQVTMIRKYHNHALQANQRHREEEPQNTDWHNTSGRRSKQSNQRSFPKMIAKLDTNDWITKPEPSTECPQTMGATMNHQQQSHRLRMDSSLPGGGGGVYSIFSAYVGSDPASTVHPQKISGILSTPNFFLKF